MDIRGSGFSRVNRQVANSRSEACLTAIKLRKLVHNVDRYVDKSQLLIK
jgi:hypothetical protein